MPTLLGWPPLPVLPLSIGYHPASKLGFSFRAQLQEGMSSGLGEGLQTYTVAPALSVISQTLLDQKSSWYPFRLWFLKFLIFSNHTFSFLLQKILLILQINYFLTILIPPKKTILTENFLLINLYHIVFKIYYFPTKHKYCEGKKKICINFTNQLGRRRGQEALWYIFFQVLFRFDNILSTIFWYYFT